MMEALFATYEIPLPPLGSMPRGTRVEENEARSRKKERREMEAARRGSLAEEEARQMRAEELSAGRLAPELWSPREALLMCCC